MIAPSDEPVKKHKSEVSDWMKKNGFQLIGKQWVGESRCVLVTPLINNRVLIQVGVPA
jgi:hypothetical protein